MWPRKATPAAPAPKPPSLGVQQEGIEREGNGVSAYPTRDGVAGGPRQGLLGTG